MRFELLSLNDLDNLSHVKDLFYENSGVRRVHVVHDLDVGLHLTDNQLTALPLPHSGWEPVDERLDEAARELWLVPRLIEGVLVGKSVVGDRGWSHGGMHERKESLLLRIW